MPNSIIRPHRHRTAESASIMHFSIMIDSSDLELESGARWQRILSNNHKQSRLIHYPLMKHAIWTGSDSTSIVVRTACGLGLYYTGFTVAHQAIVIVSFAAVFFITQSPSDTIFNRRHASFRAAAILFVVESARTGAGFKHPAALGLEIHDRSDLNCFRN